MKCWVEKKTKKHGGRNKIRIRTSSVNVWLAGSKREPLRELTSRTLVDDPVEMVETTR